ncbi:MAG: AraC family transcriptional regulator [Flavobacterium sp.]
MTLDNWPKNIQKYLFLLKDDFFQIPYLFNSPEIMIDSLLKIPVMNHLPSKQVIKLKTSLCKAKLCYREIEDGFWLLAIYMTIKENIVTRSFYDRNKASDYYLLTFSVFEYKVHVKEEEEISILSTCWTFSKPETEISSYFYKGANGGFFSFAITKEWASKNFSSKKFKNSRAIKKFFNGERGSYTWMDIAPKAHEMGAELSAYLKENNNPKTDKASLKKKSMKLIMEFFDNAFDDSRITDNISLSNLDYHNVAKAEKIILQNLHLPFIGIETIAKEVHTSPTKLKSNFKIVFGFSMLQYHKEKNMLLAMQLLQNSTIHVQNIALLTGYDSAGRFAASFKKRFGQLPSEVRF